MIRFGGLGTGQDTQAIVDALLEVERVPIQRIENEIIEEEEKFSAWNELDTKFSDLHTKAQKLTSFLTWRQNDVTSTNEDVVTGSANFEAALSSYAVNVTSLAKSHMIGSNKPAITDVTADAGTPAGTFTLNGEQVTVSSGDSLEDIRDAINDASANMSDPVTASIINTTLVIERNATGATDITFDDDSDGILQDLGFWDGVSTGVFDNELQASQNLSASVNGVAVAGATNTGLTSIINGVTLNFKSEGSSTLNVERDTDTIQTAFEDFVDSYNAAIELAEEQTKVSLSGSGDRISDVGALQGDQAVNSLRFNSRRLVTSSLVDPVISNGFNTLQDIGIWTEGDQNRLSILSADKLKDALENNFEDVEDLIRDFDNGVLRNFEEFTDEVRSPVDGTIARRQTSLRNSIIDKEERISDINLLILDKETELFQHFAQMESAVASINSQGSFISGQLGG